MSDQESSDRRGAQPDSAPQSGPGQPTAPESETVAPDPPPSAEEASAEEASATEASATEASATEASATEADANEASAEPRASESVSERPRSEADLEGADGDDDGATERQVIPDALMKLRLKPRSELRAKIVDEPGESSGVAPTEASYSAASRVSSVAIGSEMAEAARRLTDASAPALEPTPAVASGAESSHRESPRPARRKSRGQDAPVFFVAGFWHRSVAALLDLAVIIPVALLGYSLVSRLGGVELPSSRHHGVDFWLDLLLDGDPALITLVALLVALATIYVLVFQITLSHTPGMRVMKIRIVDQYGTPPSTAQAAARTAGYVASAATLGLGFIWIGFDSEKRGLHDWLSGTYVVRA